MTNDTKFPHQIRGPRHNPDEVSIGEVFGYWKIIGPYSRYGIDNQAHFPCRCRCGVEKDRLFRSLREARKGIQGISCGCYQKEVMATKRKHGEPGTKEHQKSRWLWTQYRMTPEQYDNILEVQGGGCYICGVTDKLHIDHNHDTGKIRGILCADHNLGIGHFRENIAHMLKAIEYINKYSEEL